MPISLSSKDESNPLNEYSSLVKPGGLVEQSDSMGLSTADSPDDPASVNQLSERAWLKMNPEYDVAANEVQRGDVSHNSTFTPSGSGLGPSGMSTSGVSDLGEIPDWDDVTYGNPDGGNFVTDDADIGRTIVRAAKAMLGKPYVWGGEDWSGADCSGLVQLAYKQAGIEMPRLSNHQMMKGKRVDYKDLKPGDLIGWNNSNHVVGADHIAIYIGNGQIIQAPRPGQSIRVDGLFDYGTNMMWAVRIPGKHVAPTKPKPKPKPKQGTTSIRAVENSSPKPKPKKPKTHADVHSTGRLAVRN